MYFTTLVLEEVNCTLLARICMLHNIFIHIHQGLFAISILVMLKVDRFFCSIAKNSYCLLSNTLVLQKLYGDYASFIQRHLIAGLSSVLCSGLRKISLLWRHRRSLCVKRLRRGDHFLISRLCCRCPHWRHDFDASSASCSTSSSRSGIILLGRGLATSCQSQTCTSETIATTRGVNRE